ncbi:MAG: hypothetical protein NZ893_01305 [Candidatus Aenigmarchaeota archaeon]|nr:hypothetical protein [Candidatus Aenigmarchaeota archaeon]
MKPFYKISTTPKMEARLKIDDTLRKIEKNKPWFLILNKSILHEEYIEFFDENAGAKGKIDSKGFINYEEMIFLENEIDVIRTMAIIVGFLKLAKIVYVDEGITFKLLFEVKNIKNKHILENKDLLIPENLKVKNDVLVEGDVDFKSLNSVEFVTKIMLEALTQIGCKVDEKILKNEIKKSIEVLDNPLLFATKSIRQ